VTRPSAPQGPQAPDDEELALEVDALINELGVGVDTSSIQVEAVEPARSAAPKDEDDEGFVALSFEEGAGEAIDDPDATRS